MGKERKPKEYYKVLIHLAKKIIVSLTKGISRKSGREKIWNEAEEFGYKHAESELIRKM